MSCPIGFYLGSIDCVPVNDLPGAVQCTRDLNYNTCINCDKTVSGPVDQPYFGWATLTINSKGFNACFARQFDAGSPDAELIILYPILLLIIMLIYIAFRRHCKDVILDYVIKSILNVVIFPLNIISFYIMMYFPTSATNYVAHTSSSMLDMFIIEVIMYSLVLIFYTVWCSEDSGRYSYNGSVSFFSQRIIHYCMMLITEIFIVICNSYFQTCIYNTEIYIQNTMDDVNLISLDPDLTHSRTLLLSFILSILQLVITIYCIIVEFIRNHMRTNTKVYDYYHKNIERIINYNCMFQFLKGITDKNSNLKYLTDVSLYEPALINEIFQFAGFIQPKICQKKNAKMVIKVSNPTNTILNNNQINLLENLRKKIRTNINAYYIFYKNMDNRNDWFYVRHLLNYVEN